MGFFRRSKPEPIVHPAVARTIYVEADRAALTPHVEGYAGIMGRRARTIEVDLRGSGPWIRLDLQVDGVHPWEFHNLAYWLLEIGRVVAVSGPSPTHDGYHLVRADDANDLLEGWTDGGEPLAIHVPGNDVVRPDPAVPGPPQTADEVLEVSHVPELGWTDLGAIDVRTDDPGRNLNPTLAATKRRRADLRPIYFDS
ncbi:MAG: hypothetical protein AAGA99_09090 [Actinomycetota bacterium]